jgi:hypothetical protein
MQLTPEDKKIVASLRKQHNGWKTGRFVILIVHSILFAIALWELKTKSEPAAGAALLGISAYGLSYVLGAWHGRPEITLLLKLVEATFNKDIADK